MKNQAGMEAALNLAFHSIIAWFKLEVESLLYKRYPSTQDQISFALIFHPHTNLKCCTVKLWALLHSTFSLLFYSISKRSITIIFQLIAIPNRCLFSLCKIHAKWYFQENLNQFNVIYARGNNINGIVFPLCALRYFHVLTY